MVTETQIRQCLDEVTVPQTWRSLNALNLIREITINNGTVSLTLASAALSERVREALRTQVVQALSTLVEAKNVSVTFNDDKPKDINRIKQVITVMSGKGGVGKSLTTALIATGLRRQGHRVGVLDADITGPSIPRMFGITGRPGGSSSGILPLPSKTGIQVISINLLLENEEEAVVWRGPLIAKVITQFWEEVLWGELDYLVVDLPPGTADAPLTILQQIPDCGVVIVYTPQDLTTMIVKKAVNMARNMERKVIGVVENMSYFYVPELDKKFEIFGVSGGEAIAQAAAAPLLGQIPIDPYLAALCDRGDIEDYQSDIVTTISDRITGALCPR
jgi:Mrp family chromosome partitioning ATPase